ARQGPTTVSEQCAVGRTPRGGWTTSGGVPLILPLHLGEDRIDRRVGELLCGRSCDPLCKPAVTLGANEGLRPCRPYPGSKPLGEGTRSRLAEDPGEKEGKRHCVSPVVAQTGEVVLVAERGAPG